MLVLSLHQVVHAQVLVAAAHGVALVIGIHLVEVLSRSLLDCDHGVVGGEEPVVGGVLELAVEFVAGALLRVLAAIGAFAQSCSLFLFQVLLNVTITEKVLV